MGGGGRGRRCRGRDKRQLVAAFVCLRGAGKEGQAGWSP